MRPRLAFLIRDLGFGGAQRQLTTLARGLAAQGTFDVHVVSFYDGPLRSELESAGIEFHCVEKRHRWDLIGFFLRLVATLRRIQPDVVHGYLAEANLMASTARPLIRSPVIVWGIRDSQTDAHQWGILGKVSFRLNTLLSGTTRGLIANSHAGRQWYRQQGYPMDDEDFRVIPNGINTDRFQPQGSKGPFRKAWKLDDSAILIGCVGRLNPMKDHPTFLRAASRIAAENTNARFVILGSGPEGYRSELAEQARQLGLSNRLIWEAPHEDLEDVYPAFDLLVSSSSFGEGFSNVIAEAMACGIPCVATSVGDSALLIGDTGWTCEPDDADALAAAVLQVLEMPADQRLELGSAARRRIEEHFSIDLLVQRTTQALKDWVPAE